MKKISVFLCFLLVLGAAFVSAQPVEGKKFEAGTAVDFYCMNVGGATQGSYLYVPLHFGWYVWKGLEIEPEFAVNIPLKYTNYIDVTCIGTINAFYNYKVGKKLVPFAGGGFSLGNGIPYAQSQYGQLYGDANMNTTAYNLGCGLKYLLTDSVVVRAEYRYSRYRMTSDGGTGSENINIHRAFVGLSFLF